MKIFKKDQRYAYRIPLIRKYSFKKSEMGRDLRQKTSAFGDVFSDHEVKMLIFWAIVGPLFAFAYLVWNKKPTLKPIAVLLFAVSIAVFALQTAAMAESIFKLV
jgi:hypothetical protein